MCLHRKRCLILSKSGITSENKPTLRLQTMLSPLSVTGSGFSPRLPAPGHMRQDLTNEDVKFFPVYSYLIVYRPKTKPLQIACILHGRRDVEQVLKGRL